MRKPYLLTAALLLPAGLLLLAAQPLPAQQLRLEAEGYTDSGDLSQLPIKGMDNPSCSGGVSLVGLDCAGEWTAYDALSVPADGTYAVSVHYRAQAGKPVLLRLALTPEGQAAAAAVPREIELSLPGSGFGWGSWHDVTVRDTVDLQRGTYQARLTAVSGGRVEIDYLLLSAAGG